LGSLLWIAPLIWISGGPLDYWHESQSLASRSSGSTSIFHGNLPGIGRNWTLVGSSLLGTLGAAIVPLLLVVRRPRLALPREAGPEREFLALWIMPGLLVFLFLHMGQPGYILLLTPPLYLAVVGAWPKSIPTARVPVIAAVGALIAANAWLALVAPALVYERVGPRTAAGDYFRQYVPAENDAHWQLDQIGIGRAGDHAIARPGRDTCRHLPTGSDVDRRLDVGNRIEAGPVHGKVPSAVTDHPARPQLPHYFDRFFESFETDGG
jgi:hypothetical protein